MRLKAIVKLLVGNLNKFLIYVLKSMYYIKIYLFRIMKYNRNIVEKFRF